MAMIPTRNRKRMQEGGEAEAVTQNPFTGTVPEQKTTLSSAETISPTPLSLSQDELVSQDTGQLTDTTVAPTAAAPTINLNSSIPATQSANTYSAYTTLDTPTAIAAQGSLDSRSLVGEPSMMANATALEQGVSQGSQAQAAQGTVSSLSTVQGQLGNLLEQLNTPGADLPSWAAPAVRKVNAIMNQRGLGASSMASAAITQAIYESALPIATQDANKYAALDIANLNNRQQAVLQNATVYAAMDKANLDARMTAATNNAKAFLSLDLANLTEQNKVNMLDFQGRMQDLLADQSAENAAQQFNAKSETQVMEFFAELGSQIENANKTREAAMNQFNTSESNSMAKFNAQLEDQRAKFNAQMGAQIEQANANWRRQINTANTELINETNRINSQNLLGLSATAQDQLWQRYRDEAQWVVSSAESQADRAHKVAILGQQNTYNVEQYDKERKDLLMSSLAETTFEGILSYIVK
tara:strand:+ start:237 stop:1649 length:1413 start_codon:yes stop_codon:yes gene_type:complete